MRRELVCTEAATPPREALAEGVRARRLALPIGIAVPLDNAVIAFDHVSAGLAGRAVLQQ